MSEKDKNILMKKYLDEIRPQLSDVIDDLKDYLHYKRMTYQNLSSEAQIKGFFYFVEKLFYILKIFTFLYF